MLKNTLAACLVACSVNASAVNKCTDAKTSQVTYSDAPCAAGAVKAAQPDLRGNLVEGNPAGERGLRQDLQRSSRMRGHIERGQVVLGMTEDEVVASWGQPNTVNSSVYADGRSNQWVFRRGGNGVQYVYTKNGLVTAVQSQPDEVGLGGGNGSPGAGKGCHSEQTIRNAQTSATSILLSEQQRREALDRIALMRPC